MWRPFWTIAVTALVVDQFSKWLVVHRMDLISIGRIDVLPPFVTFQMAWNRGINFGLFPAGSDLGRWVLIGIALVICGALLVWLHKEKPRPLAMGFGGLLLGGAFGNVADRLIYGAVADFLNVTCCGIDNPYAFNVADAAIFAGAAGLILFTGKQTKA